MREVLVTGGAGFIGSHVCERLITKGYYVINLDNFNNYYDPQIKEDNIKNVMVKPH
ncbi:NAD-dependent epimerase/dehydratase family protein [Desulfitibacter alkalitolerans]|uniref:NAD-dependent epimerase/dehydratase family protein n=1 Tax=Desulfitibacter alkalitolerans TaxID=264641 RepID=UPI000A04612B|nr:NAD-dependent epimerase/dehydratase family protein [Desulfitibacter alkalitolerans]